MTLPVNGQKAAILLRKIADRIEGGLSPAPDDVTTLNHFIDGFDEDGHHVTIQRYEQHSLPNV